MLCRPTLSESYITNKADIKLEMDIAMYVIGSIYGTAEGLENIQYTCYSNRGTTNERDTKDRHISLAIQNVTSQHTTVVLLVITISPPPGIERNSECSILVKLEP